MTINTVVRQIKTCSEKIAVHFRKMTGATAGEAGDLPSQGFVTRPVTWVQILLAESVVP